MHCLYTVVETERTPVILLYTVVEDERDIYSTFVETELRGGTGRKTRSTLKN